MDLPWTSRLACVTPWFLLGIVVAGLAAVLCDALADRD
jgi:hypothetical protein